MPPPWPAFQLLPSVFTLYITPPMSVTHRGSLNGLVTQENLKKKYIIYLGSLIKWAVFHHRPHLQFLVC